MNPISSIVRIVLGLVLVIVAYSSYNRIAVHVEAGERIEIFGYVTNAAQWQMTLAYAAIGLIGIFLIILGTVNLLKSR